jgi:hypothetical protein
MSTSAAVLVFVGLCVLCYGAYWLYEEIWGESTFAAIVLWVAVFGVGGYLISVAAG